MDTTNLEAFTMLLSTQYAEQLERCHSGYHHYMKIGLVSLVSDVDYHPFNPLCPRSKVDAITSMYTNCSKFGF